MALLRYLFGVGLLLNSAFCLAEVDPWWGWMKVCAENMTVRRGQHDIAVKQQTKGKATRWVFEIEDPRTNETVAAAVQVERGVFRPFHVYWYLVPWFEAIGSKNEEAQLVPRGEPGEGSPLSSIMLDTDAIRLTENLELRVDDDYYGNFGHGIRVPLPRIFLRPPTLWQRLTGYRSFSLCFDRNDRELTVADEDSAEE